MRLIRGLRRSFLEYQLWVRQGRRRDRWTVTQRGTFESGTLVGWSLSPRFCRDETVVGVRYESGDIFVGGYTREELLALPV